MNVMLTKTSKATAVLLFFAAVLFLLAVPAYAFSETYGGMNFEKERSFSVMEGPVKVILVTNGEEETYTYFPVQCSEFLEYAGINLSEIDSINVPGDMILYNNVMIDVATVEYQEVVVEEKLSYGYNTVEVDTIPKGTTKVVKEGTNGVIKVTYLQKKIDGVAVSRELIAQEVLSLPVNGTQELGVGGTVKASDGTVYKYSYKRLMEATAYTYVPGKTTWKTATGAELKKGIVAVDPKVIPLHTEMYIASDTFEYGYGIAEDTGGAIKGNIIDLAFMTVDECYSFGRRNIWVYFIER